MKNVTLAIDEMLLEAGRAYARAHNTSLNNLIRDSLYRTVIKETQAAWASKFLEVAGKANGKSCVKPWKREDLYRG